MNKLLVILKIKIDSLLSGFNALKSNKGQNTIEYLIMLAVLVTIVVAVGSLMQGSLNEVWESVKSKIMEAIGK